MRSENVFAYTDTDPAAVYPEYVSINKDETGELSITVRTATLGGVGFSRLPREKIGALVDALAPYRADPVEERTDEPELPMFNNDGPWVAQLASAVATDTYAIASDPMRTCQTCKYGSKPSGSHEGCDECMAGASRPHWTGCCGKCGACDSPHA